MRHDTHDGLDVVSPAGHLAVIPLGEGPQPSGPTLVRAPVIEHHHVTDRYWRIRLEAPGIALTAQPGQFLMLTIAREGETSPVLPRPMAIYAVDPVQGHVDVMYGVVGAGTRRLSSFTVGEPLTVVGPLGRGFVLHSATRTALLLGRGIGTCSLTALAASAASGGVRVLAVDSARDSNALIADKAYREAGVDWLMQVIDADGSSDPGLVRSRLLGELDASPPEQIFVCGSNRLIGLATDLGARWLADTQVSLEAHMACGLGYCHGCSSGQRSAEREAPLICRDGPVFRWGPGPGFPS